MRATEAASALSAAQAKIAALHSANEKLSAEVEQSRTQSATEATAGAERARQELSAAAEREAALTRNLTEMRGQWEGLQIPKRP